MTHDSLEPPDYTGGSLVNLVSELEARLTGEPTPMPGLHPNLAALLPSAATYVLVLFDGLGARQLDHPAAASLLAASRGTLDAPFPTTTTVSLASIATGLPPSRHGLLGYTLWMPELKRVVNTIRWTTLWGQELDYDTTDFLPAPNTWERLSAARCEPITVQPGAFAGTSLTRSLYRGCRFEGVYDLGELADAACQLARQPGRLVFVYVANVDYAAHVHGQHSAEYAEAVSAAVWAWQAIARGLPEGAVAVGTADHGHLDFPTERQYKIPEAAHKGVDFYGDGRVMFVRGDGAGIADEAPAVWLPRHEMESWWGPGPRHPTFESRAPTGVLVAEPDHLLLHKHSDDRMIGNHGGLLRTEIEVPLLVATPGR